MDVGVVGRDVDVDEEETSVALVGVTPAIIKNDALKEETKKFSLAPYPCMNKELCRQTNE